MLPMIGTVTRYLLFWGLVWLLQLWFAPDWLVDSRGGLQTILQVVPTVVITVYALILASVLVVAQLAITNYGTRAAMMMLRDNGVRQLVMRPFLLGAGSLLLLGQVPDSGAPSAAITAAGATIVLATFPVIASTAVGLPGTLVQYTAPVTFAGLVIQDIEEDLSNGFTNLVVFKVPLLGEMLRTSIRRGDSVAVSAGLQALSFFHEAYIRATTRNRAARTHAYEGAKPEEGYWFGDSLRLSLVRAGEEGLSLGAPEEDVNGIAWVLRDAAKRSLEAGQTRETQAFVEGLLQMAVTVHQVTTSGTLNFFAAPTQALAGVECKAEEVNDDDLAVRALASWALASAYPRFHFNIPEHPTFEFDLEDLGPAPPFEAARSLVQSERWRRRWSNKQYRGPEPVVKLLDRAQRSLQRGRS